MKPRFSVIIPTLNEEKFVSRLLESLADQTFQDFEVIVADGGSKDATTSVVGSFERQLPDLKILTGKGPNVAAQRNFGAKEANAGWLVFIDADSILLPTLLQEVDHYLSTHETKLLNVWCLPDGNSWWERVLAMTANLVGELTVPLHRQLAAGNLTIVEKRAFKEVGGYNESLRWGEDYEISERLADHRVTIAFLRKRLYKMSFRRMRREGVLPTLWLYIKSGIRAAFTRKTYSAVGGYIQGGQLYGK